MIVDAPCSKGTRTTHRIMVAIKLLGRLSLPWLILGFAVGFAAVYMIEPKRRVVVEFPSPYNAGQVTYVGHHGDAIDGDGRIAKCFQFRAEPVICPDDRKLISVQPKPSDDREKFMTSGSDMGGGMMGGCPSMASMFLQDGVDQLSPQHCGSSCTCRECIGAGCLPCRDCPRLTAAVLE